MTIKESAKMLALIKIVYPSAYKDIDEDTTRATINIWQHAFEDVPYIILSLAFENFCKKSKYPPTIAEMYEEIKSLYYTAAYGNTSNGADAQRKYVIEQTSRFRGEIEHQINYRCITKEMMLETQETNLLKGVD